MTARIKVHYRKEAVVLAVTFALSRASFSAESEKKPLEPKDAKPKSISKLADLEFPEASLKREVNRFKYFDLGFGILPNSDNKTNSLANLNINYSPFFKSSIEKVDRNFSSQNLTTSSEALSGTSQMTSTEEKKSNIERTEYYVRLLQFQAFKSNIGLIELKPNFGIGADFYKENKLSTDYRRRSFSDPILATKTRTVIESDNIRETNSGTLPKIELSLDIKIKQSSKVSLRSEYFFQTSEKTVWEQKGSAFIPPFSLDQSLESSSELIEISQNRNTTFKSSGFKFNFSSDLDTPIGGLVFGGELSQFEGDKSIFSIKTDRLSPEIDPSTGKDKNEGKYTRSLIDAKVTEQRTLLTYSFGYRMSFLKDYGIEPIVTVNKYDLIITDTPRNGSAVTQRTDLYDFGLVFNY